ncbi:hypothetical protein BGX20_008755 [Mortierella sp. AD010]|nr:hypothetical protein BGX20_008755 [Mortierella sp. AD010]
MEGNSVAVSPDGAFDDSLSSLHFHQRQQQQYEKQQQQKQQQRIISYSTSHSTSSASTRESIPNKNNYCRSLLDPRPQNALDWLKCLIQTSQEDNSRDHSYRNHKAKDLEITLDSKMDFGPVGEAISKRTSSTMRGIRSRSLDAEVGAVVAPPANNSLRTQPHPLLDAKSHTHRLSPHTSNSLLVSMNEDHAEESGAPSFTGSGPASPAASGSPNSPNSQAPAPVSLAAVAAAAVAAHRNAEAETRSKTSLEQHASTSSDTSLSHARTPASSNSTVALNVNGNENAESNTNGSASINSSTTTTVTPSRISAVIPSKDFLYSATGVIQKSIIKSKNATTAFFYRTFSPTYRVSRLYIDSWTNGSQRRGLERIKNSVVRGDAFSLARGTTTQMKDIWNQVMASYRAKRNSTKGTKITSTTSTREKSSNLVNDSDKNQNKDCESGNNINSSDGSDSKSNSSSTNDGNKTQS